MLSTKDGNYAERFTHIERPKFTIKNDVTDEQLTRFKHALENTGSYLITLPSDKVELMVEIKEEYHHPLSLKIREITIEHLELNEHLFVTRIRSGKYPEGHTICAYLIHKYCFSFSLKEIAAINGRKSDHTSVLYHVGRAQKLIEAKDEKFIQLLFEIESKLKQYFINL